MATTIQNERETKQIREQISTEEYQKLVRKVKSIEGRMRMQDLVRLLPFAFLAGGLVGLVVAIWSRITPTFTTEQVLIIALATILFSLAACLSYAMFRPRSLLATAYRADRALGLKERISTAIEGYNNPSKIGYLPLGRQQFQDAYLAVEKVKAGKALPLKFDKRAAIAALILIPLLGLALFLPNPNSEVVKENQAVREQVQKEITKLEELKNAVKKDAEQKGVNKDDPQLKELLKQLEQAQQDLRDKSNSREDAIAALEQVKQQLQGKTDPNQEAKKAAIDSLARDFKNFDSTRPAGNALSQTSNPNRFNNAASELEKTANNINQLQNDPKQAQDLANSLAQNAQNMASAGDQALADKLQKAAQALDSKNLSQNPQAAQQALNDLAKQLQQSGQNQAMQDQIQQAQSQLQKSEQAISQAGQKSQGQNNAGKNGQRGGDNGEFSNDPGSNLGDGQFQEGQQGQQGQDGQQQGDGQQGQGQGGQSGQQGPNGQQGQNGQGQNGQNGQDGQGNGQGDGQNGNAQGDSQGQGQGDGQQGNGQGGSKAGRGSNDNIYPNATARRNNGTQTNVNGKQGNGPSTSQQVNGGTPAGDAQVPYSQVLQEYSDAASQALDKNYVPSTLKDVIKQYFNDLNDRNK